MANTARRSWCRDALIHIAALWRKSFACLEWNRHPRRGKAPDPAAVWWNVATGISLQVADLPRGQSWDFLLLWTEMRSQHEPFYTAGVKPVSSLHRQLVSTKKVIWTCDFFFFFFCLTFLTFTFSFASIRCMPILYILIHRQDLFFPCICWRLVAVWIFNLFSRAECSDCGREKATQTHCLWCTFKIPCSQSDYQIGTCLYLHKLYFISCVVTTLFPNVQEGNYFPCWTPEILVNKKKLWECSSSLHLSYPFLTVLPFPSAICHINFVLPLFFGSCQQESFSSHSTLKMVTAGSCLSMQKKDKRCPPTPQKTINRSVLTVHSAN